MQMSPDFNWSHVAYWEHYKGGKYILIEGNDYVGWLEEDFDKEDLPDDMKEVVIYKKLAGGRPWVRRKAYFFGQVELENGKKVPRFRSVTWEEAFYRRNEGRI